MSDKLHTLFTPEDLAPVATGIRKFIRALGLELASYQLKWVADEFDLVSALKIITQYVDDSASLLGRQKYKNQPYVFTDEVKKDMEEFLLVGRDAKETALMRKQNLGMYHLVVEPTIDLLGKLSHEQALTNSHEIIAEIVGLVENSDDYGDHYDALVAKEQIGVMIRARAAAKEASKKRTVRRKIKPAELEMLPTEEIADVLAEDSSDLIFE